MIVPQPSGPKNTDGAIYSPEVEIPAPRPVDWQAVAWRQADEIAALRRLLHDHERQVAFGYLSQEGDFGTAIEEAL